MEDVTCDLCGAADRKIVWTKGRFGMALTTVVCRRCGLVFTSPRMTEEEMREFYEKEYRLAYSGTHTPTDKLLKKFDANATRRFGQVTDHIPVAEIGKVLDVGCGCGHFVSKFSEDVDRHGIEPNDALADYANKNFGVTAYSGFIEDEAFTERQFDLVTFFHVLEHVRSPSATLKRVHELLADDGWLCIEVPDIYRPYYGDLSDFFQNAHPYSFSTASLTALLLKAGFSNPLAVFYTGNFLTIITRKCGTKEISPDDFLPDPDEANKVISSLRKWRLKYMLFYSWWIPASPYLRKLLRR